MVTELLLHVPGPMLSPSPVCVINLRSIPMRQYNYYPHFTDDQLEIQRPSSLPKIPWMESGRAGVHSHRQAVLFSWVQEAGVALKFRMGRALYSTLFIFAGVFPACVGISSEKMFWPPLRIYASFLIERIQKYLGGKLQLAGQSWKNSSWPNWGGGDEEEALLGHSDPRGCKQRIQFRR